MNDDELISAYFDGELQGADLARAEQLLAASEASRQLLDELRALRGSLQGLPRQSLGADFADRVLRRAEREVLLPTAAELGLQESESPPVEPLQTAERGWWRPQGRRPWVYAAAALAAGLLVMVLTSEQREGPFQNVALHEAPAGKPTADAHVTELRRSEPATVTASTPSNAPIGSMSATHLPVGGAGAMSVRNSAAESPNLVITATPPGSLSTETFNFRSSGDLPGLRASLEAAGAGEWYTPLVRQTAQNDLGRLDLYTGGTTVSGGVVTAALASDLVIVQCHIRPSEWREAEFEQLLGDNAIQVQPVAASAQQMAARAKQDNLAANYRTDAFTRDTKLELEGVAAGKAAPPRVATGYDAYYVVADTEQLAATVAKLSQQPGAVVDVQVAAAPSAPQQKVWDHYGVRVTPTAEAEQLTRGFITQKKKTLQDVSSAEKKLDAELPIRQGGASLPAATTPPAAPPAQLATPQSTAPQPTTLQLTRPLAEQVNRAGYAQRLFLLTQEESLNENQVRLADTPEKAAAAPRDERKMDRDLKRESTAGPQDASSKVNVVDKLSKLGVDTPAQRANHQPQPAHYQRALFVFRPLEPSPTDAKPAAAAPAKP